MFLQAKLKSKHDNAQYRVYINDELITERFFVIPYASLQPIGDLACPITIDDVSNILNLEITDQPKYDIKVESITDQAVHLHDWHVQENPYEN